MNKDVHNAYEYKITLSEEANLEPSTNNCCRPFAEAANKQQRRQQINSHQSASCINRRRETTT